MKVIHRSDSLLMLEDRPWVLGVLLIAMAMVFLFGGMAMIGEGKLVGGALFGLFGASVPLLIGALMVKRVRLALDLGSGQLTRTSRSLRGLTQDGYPMERLVRATVGASVDSDGTTYRMELLLEAPNEIVPFTSYYTNGNKPQLMADTVNGWLAGRNDAP